MTRMFRVDKLDKQSENYINRLDKYVGEVLELAEENDNSLALFTPDRSDYWYFDKEWLTEVFEDEQEHTGGSVNYYKVEVKTPTTFEQPYWAECNDLIEALDMNYAEGNAFKAIWRRCAERQGRKKKGNNTYYDAEKLSFFAQRILEQEKEKQ